MIQRFALTPFGAAPGELRLELDGVIALHENALSIRYELRGRLNEVALPPQAAKPARRHGLWQETCFEFFLGLKDSPVYWEFNLSPSGHWNVYRFEDYRRGIQEEKAFTALPFRVRRHGDVLEVSLEVDLTLIVPPGRSLEAGVTAVVKLVNGEMTYRALAHPGPRPDFHRRDGFIVEL
jgi:hypothetical protein